MVWAEPRKPPRPDVGWDGFPGEGQADFSFPLYWDFFFKLFRGGGLIIKVPFQSEAMDGYIWAELRKPRVPAWSRGGAPGEEVKGIFLAPPH